MELIAGGVLELFGSVLELAGGVLELGAVEVLESLGGVLELAAGVVLELLGGVLEEAIGQLEVYEVRVLVLLSVDTIVATYVYVEVAVPSYLVLVAVETYGACAV